MRVQESRDTMCSQCYKWTHRLTPGGTGRIFCDQYCAARYDREHGTQYAFERYHYLAPGQIIQFTYADSEINEEPPIEWGWNSLLRWCTRDHNRPTMASLVRQYTVRRNGNKIEFEKI